MEQRFNKIFDYILLVEGGYSNHPLDNGGATKYGIIERVAREHGYKGDMKELSKEIAKSIYYEDYYLKNKLDNILNTKVALSIFDFAVNCGNVTAKKKVQIALNNLGFKLVVDGILGIKTISALNDVDVDKFLNEYHTQQKLYYHRIVKKNPSQIYFLKGWLNRVAKKESYLKQI